MGPAGQDGGGGDCCIHGNSLCLCGGVRHGDFAARSLRRNVRPELPALERNFLDACVRLLAGIFQVIAQAQEQLGLALQPLKTVVEKRATFACTPNLVRPDPHIVPGLIACGDYIDGPYPATLEGAVRSGITAARSLA